MFLTKADPVCEVIFADLPRAAQTVHHVLLLVLLDEEDVEHLLLAHHAVVHWLIGAVTVKPKNVIKLDKRIITNLMADGKINPA